MFYKVISQGNEQRMENIKKQGSKQDIFQQGRRRLLKLEGCSTLAKTERYYKTNTKIYSYLLYLI